MSSCRSESQRVPALETLPTTDSADGRWVVGHIPESSRGAVVVAGWERRVRLLTVSRLAQDARPTILLAIFSAASVH